MAMLSMILLAEGSATGWLGEVIQCGSFGLLSYAILVLFPSLREKMAVERRTEIREALELANAKTEIMATELRDARVSHAQELREARKEYSRSLKDTTDAFRDEACAERQACEGHFKTLADAMNKGNETTIRTVDTMAQQIQSHAERNQQWFATLQAEIAARKKETTS